jgi:RHS repeat-associated protein
MTQSIGYDVMSRLSSVYSSGGDNEAYTYDTNGNRLTQQQNGASVSYATNASKNQVSGLSGSSTVSYSYDANGNLTTVSGAPTFSYDAFNRMSAAGSATYYVGPEGQRLRKSVSGSTTYFAPDAGGPMLADNQGTGWSDYIWLNGRLIGRINGGQILAIHADQVGRPEVMTDPSKAIVWRAKNYAFDRTVTVANAVPLNLGFPGQYYDAESGLWNNGFRDYSPALGRYVESDPAGLTGGINTYAYVGSDPLLFVDFAGLCKCKPVKAILTGVGGTQATADGALYSKYPAEAGGSIKGGTFGTVAVQRGFLGLSTRQLRTYGTQITITPSNQSAITQYGGPSGSLTVSDYGDTNIQNRSGLAFDLYRFPTVDDGLKFGNQTMDVTIEFPDDVPAQCPSST